MKPISIFNDVLGPVMHGPSSSHTAASVHIGTLARALLGEEPASAVLTFDPNGSYAQVYSQQGSDLAFATGLMGWAMTDDRPARTRAQGRVGQKVRRCSGASSSTTTVRLQRGRHALWEKRQRPRSRTTTSW